MIINEDPCNLPSITEQVKNAEREKCMHFSPLHLEREFQAANKNSD